MKDLPFGRIASKPAPLMAFLATHTSCRIPFGAGLPRHKSLFQSREHFVIFDQQDFDAGNAQERAQRLRSDVLDRHRRQDFIDISQRQSGQFTQIFVTAVARIAGFAEAIDKSRPAVERCNTSAMMRSSVNEQILRETC